MDLHDDLETAPDSLFENLFMVEGAYSERPRRLRALMGLLSMRGERTTEDWISACFGEKDLVDLLWTLDRRFYRRAIFEQQSVSLGLRRNWWKPTISSHCWQDLGFLPYSVSRRTSGSMLDRQSCTVEKTGSAVSRGRCTAEMIKERCLKTQKNKKKRKTTSCDVFFQVRNFKDGTW